jgi:hypothetical protein
MTSTENRRGAYRVLLSDLQRKKPLGRPRDNGGNIKKHLKKNGIRWTGLI